MRKTPTKERRKIDDNGEKNCSNTLNKNQHLLGIKLGIII